MINARAALVLATLAASCGGRSDEPAPGARADFINAAGANIGTAVLNQGTNEVEIRVDLKALPPGAHGFHLHSVGKCEPPFDSAGPHLNPAGRKHGALNPEGAHAGDLANAPVQANGNARVQTVATGITLESLFDADGSALVIHAGQDDYKTDPSGNSGARIACAVIRRP